MRNSQIYCFILCIWLFSCQEVSKSLEETREKPSTKNFSIVIDINGIPEGKAYLNILDTQRLKKIDSVSLSNSQFNFNGKIDEPTLVWLTFDYTTQGIPLILEATNITVIGQVLNVKTAQIKGGILNTSYTAFKAESSLFFSKIDRRYQRFQKARLENNIQELQLIHKEISDIKAAYLQFCITYVYKHPDSFVSLIILNDLIDEKVEKKILDEAFIACTTRLKKNSFALKIAERINKL